jgi:hypothetical protein
MDGLVNTTTLLLSSFHSSIQFSILIFKSKTPKKIINYSIFTIEEPPLCFFNGWACEDGLFLQYCPSAHHAWKIN